VYASEISSPFCLWFFDSLVECSGEGCKSRFPFFSSTDFDSKWVLPLAFPLCFTRYPKRSFNQSGVLFPPPLPTYLASPFVSNLFSLFVGQRHTHFFSFPPFSSAIIPPESGPRPPFPNTAYTCVRTPFPPNLLFFSWLFFSPNHLFTSFLPASIGLNSWCPPTFNGPRISFKLSWTSLNVRKYMTRLFFAENNFPGSCADSPEAPLSFKSRQPTPIPLFLPFSPLERVSTRDRSTPGFHSLHFAYRFFAFLSLQNIVSNLYALPFPPCL